MPTSTRREITDVDRLVFARSHSTTTGAPSLDTTLKALAQRVKAASNARFLEVESNEIKTLAEGFRHMPKPDCAPAPATMDAHPQQPLRRSQLVRPRRADLDQPSQPHKPRQMQDSVPDNRRRGVPMFVIFFRLHPTAHSWPRSRRTIHRALFDTARAILPRKLPTAPSWPAIFDHRRQKRNFWPR